MLRGVRRLLLILGIVVLVSTVLLFSGSSDDAPRKRRYTPPDQKIETERKEEDEKQDTAQDNSDKSEGDEVDKDQTEGDQADAPEEKPKETENKKDQESTEPDTQTQDDVTTPQADEEQKESDDEKPEEDESEAKQHKEDEENEKQDGKPDQNDEPSSEQTTNNNDDQQTDPQTTIEEEDAGSTTPSQDDVTQTTEEEDKKNNEIVSADELEKEEDQDDITLDAESSNNDTDPHSADTTPQPKSEEAKPKKYFLIRGYPRSGTNWVSNVYNLHPKVSSIGELNLESSLWQLMQDFQQNSGLSDTYRDAMMDKVYASIRTLIFNMMDALPLHWSKMALLNKNPSIADTIEWIGDHSPQSMTFLDYVPEMKVVFIVRDPRDVAISYFFLHLTSCCKAKDDFCYRFVQLADDHEDEFKEEWDRRMEVHCANQSYYDYHPEELLVPVDSYWIEHVMAEWRERVEDYEHRLRLRGYIHLVRYEDLWNNFDEERVKLFDFLGLDAKEARPASYETKTKPGFPTNATDGFFRKGMIGDWKRWDEVVSAEAIDGARTPSSTGGMLDAGATKVAAASLCKFGYLPPARCGSTEATTTATTPAPPPSNPLDMED